MTTTDDTRAGLAALTARGHEPRREYSHTECCLIETEAGYYWHGSSRTVGVHASCYPDDAANAVRCALLERVLDRLPDQLGYVKIRRRNWYVRTDCGGYRPILAAYESLYPLPATPGEVAVEPERGKTLVELGITEESAKVPDGWERVKGGAMPTNEEQYEAMVARGHDDGLPIVFTSLGRWLDKLENTVVSEAVVSDCLLAGQLAAMEKAGISYFYNAGRQYPYQIKMPGLDKWKVYGSWFAAYLAAFPLETPAQPDPAAELAEAADMCRDAVKMFVEAIDSNSSVDVEAALEFGRKAWHAYDARFDAAKGGEK